MSSLLDSLYGVYFPVVLALKPKDSHTNSSCINFEEEEDLTSDTTVLGKRCTGVCNFS